MQYLLYPSLVVLITIVFSSINLFIASFVLFQFPPTFFDMAEKSGLYVVNCYKAFSYTKGKASSDRVQFIMRRKA